MSSWQVEHLFLRPAAEAAERFRPEIHGGQPGTDFTRGLPPKADFVASHVERFGGDAAKWGAAWDRMKAAEDAEQKARSPR